MGKHWTQEAPGNEHVALQPYLQDLKSRYRDARLAWFEVFLGMYSDSQDVAILPSRASGVSSPLTSQQAVPLNICAPIVDTGEAKIAGATRPRPYFKGVGADWSKKRKAKRLQKFIDGEFDRTGAYRIGSRVCKDGGIFGTAGAEPYLKNGQICLDRVLASEIIVDENLAHDAAPREMTRIREVSKSLLAERYPKHAKAIEALPPVGMSTKWSELVEVYDTVCLPSGAKDKDGDPKPGRRVITIPGATLSYKDYTRDYFPWVIFRWTEMPTGFFGQGLIHQVMGIQLEISRSDRNIAKSLHLLANPRVLTFEGSGIDPHHITNAWGTVLKCRKGMEPTIWTSQIVPPEYYQWVQDKYLKAFERVGMSTQSAFARKEPGVDSGKHARELSDIQADRLAPVSVRYENFYLDLAKRYVDLAEELFETDKEFSTVINGSRYAERLRWADVRLDKADYTVQMFATNFIGRTPGAAFDDVKELMASELIDANEARALMEFPDLQRVFDLRNADRDAFEQQIELILDRDLMLSPDPYMGLESLKMGKELFREAYNRARAENVEKNKLDLMRNWLDACVNLIADAEAKEAAKQAASMPPAPPAPAQMPPPEGMPL